MPSNQSNQVDHRAEPVLSQAISKRSADPVLSQAKGKKRMNTSELLASGSDITGGSQLGADFKPSHSSVICGRGKDSYNHAGNHRFRMVASMFVKRYSKASSKTDKSVIVSDIVTMIHQAGGMFCKLEKGSWVKVGDHTAREKTSALLRDLLHSQYRSSAKAKIDRRRTDNRNKKETQQDSHHPVVSTEQADDSSVASWPDGESSQNSVGWPGGESSQNSEGLENSQEQDNSDKNFFDIDVF
jgi:hypothetical protein